MNTILLGVGVFVISQYILKLILERIARVRRAIADISSTVLFRQAKSRTLPMTWKPPESCGALRRSCVHVSRRFNVIRFCPVWASSASPLNPTLVVLVIASIYLLVTRATHRKSAAVSSMRTTVLLLS